MNHKGSLLIFTTLLAGAVLLQAGEKGLPPGLQKKDKLPPGWEKKQGTAAATNAVATPATPATPAAPAAPAKPGDSVKPTAPATSATAATPATPARSQQDVKASVEKRIQTVNALDDKGGRKAVIAAISKETGVSARTLENQREQNPKVGAAGILIANELAAQTKKPARVFYRQHEDGKSWAKIAAENNVNLESLDGKLARIEGAAKVTK